MLTGATFSHSFGGTYAPPVATAHSAAAAELTHEQFCHAVRALAVELAPSDKRGELMGAKLVYGIGNGTYRGVCHYDTWQNGSRHALIEIAATGEESTVQLAGTTIHETAHVLAGWSAGHGKEWKAACRVLGLANAAAAGQAYRPEDFPELWPAISALGDPNDGRPTFTRGMNTPTGTVKPLAPCPMGRGTKGGKSTGPGSGRLRLWECACPKPVKVRVASDTFAAHCDHCGEAFAKRGAD